MHSTEQAPVSNEFQMSIRDNLKLAQDHASKNQISPQFISIERRIRIIEKHLEVINFTFIVFFKKKNLCNYLFS